MVPCGSGRLLGIQDDRGQVRAAQILTSCQARLPLTNHDDVERLLSHYSTVSIQAMA